MSETTIEMPADTTTALDDARPEAVAEPSDVGERRNLYRAGAVLTVVGVLAVGLGLTPSLITVARVLVILPVSWRSTWACEDSVWPDSDPTSTCPSSCPAHGSPY